MEYDPTKQLLGDQCYGKTIDSYKFINHTQLVITFTDGTHFTVTARTQHAKPGGPPVILASVRTGAIEKEWRSKLGDSPAPDWDKFNAEADAQKSPTDKVLDQMREITRNVQPDWRWITTNKTGLVNVWSDKPTFNTFQKKWFAAWDVQSSAVYVIPNMPDGVKFEELIVEINQIAPTYQPSDWAPDGTGDHTTIYK